NKIHGAEHGMGSVSVLDFATRKVDVTWPIPGGGSPDMGNVSADGKWLWLSGRYDDVVYVFDTTSGAVRIIKVGKEPHGLTVRPLPWRSADGAGQPATLGSGAASSSASIVSFMTDLRSCEVATSMPRRPLRLAATVAGHSRVQRRRSRRWTRSTEKSFACSRS